MLLLDSDSTRLTEERYVCKGTAHIELMERAGKNTVDIINERYDVADKKIAVVCGGGCNGGDGFVCARLLAWSGAIPVILLAGGYPKQEDCTALFEKAEKAGVLCVPLSDGEDGRFFSYIENADLIIDALFGTGLKAAPREDASNIIEKMNKSGADIVSVDIASGVCADTGEIPGACVRASLCVTFSTVKPGHLVYPGAEMCGEVICTDIGIDEFFTADQGRECRSIEFEDVAGSFGKRDRNTSKGDYGKLLCIAGSHRMPGAAYFCANAAVRSGTGLVRLATAESVYPIIAANLPDAVFYPMQEGESGALSADNIDELLLILKGSSAAVIGCGIGLCDDTRKIVRAIIENSDVPIVIDADALNVVSEEPEMLLRASAPIIITPHPGEMGRLAGTTAEQVQKKRLESAKLFSQKYGVNVILKGANTVCVTKSGKAFINTNGNPGMSKGGSGDVLAGITGSLLAQGMTAEKAMSAAVYIHGAAGDIAARKLSQHYMSPRDLTDELSEIFLKLENGE